MATAYPVDMSEDSLEPAVDPAAARWSRSSALSQLTPEQLEEYNKASPVQQEAVLQALMGAHGERALAASDDMSRADALRYGQQAQGRQAGGMYVAANPLEHIADFMRHRKGEKDFTAAKGSRDEAFTAGDKARKLAARGILVNNPGLLRGLY